MVSPTVVEASQQQLYHCKSRRKLGLVVCGDFVEWELQEDGAGVIEKVLPRKSVLQRPDRRGVQKPLAANISQLLIVAAPRPTLDTLIIDSYLAYADFIGIKAALIINKQDLIDKNTCQSISEVESIYRNLEYPVIPTCSKSPNGTSLLISQLQDHTSILVGQSGVGKSSIISALLPNQQVRINSISEKSGLGSHTTSSTTLYHLRSGGDLIDSPGVREFVIGHHDHEVIRNGFIEFNKLRAGCKFHNCSHTHEPGCRVIAAVATGEISYQRWGKLQKNSNPIVTLQDIKKCAKSTRRPRKITPCHKMQMQMIHCLPACGITVHHQTVPVLINTKIHCNLLGNKKKPTN